MKFNLSMPPRLGRSLAPAAHLRLGVAVVAAAVLAGCGSKPPAVAAKSPAAAAAKPAAAAPASSQEANATNGVAYAKSTFHVDPKFGLDPFFPGSKSQLATGQSAAAPAPQLPLPSYLKLVGIRSGTARPMALINRSAIAQGEEAEVSVVVTNMASKTEVQKVSVKCLEVRRDSVLISIAGEQGTRELRMAQAK